MQDVSSEQSSSSEELADEDSPPFGSGTFTEEHLRQEETNPPSSDSEKSSLESPDAMEVAQTVSTARRSYRRD